MSKFSGSTDKANTEVADLTGAILKYEPIYKTGMIKKEQNKKDKPYRTLMSFCDGVGGHIYVFHGGCHGCSQVLNGFVACDGCEYSRGDSSKPDLNDRKGSVRKKICKNCEMTLIRKNGIFPTLCPECNVKLR